MKSVTLKTEKDCWTTDVNPECSNESIVRYFLGQHFDRGVFPNEDMQLCIECIIDGESHKLIPA